LSLAIRWDGELRFVAENETGAAVTIEPGPAYGGSGRNPTPMELVAIALGSCSGMDMVLILQKMRVNLRRLDMSVEAVRRSEEPRYYEEIRMTYTVSGEGLTQEKADKAARLSNEKYCSVGIMLRDKAKISYEVKVV
jgi:putative redox protein